MGTDFLERLPLNARDWLLQTLASFGVPAWALWFLSTFLVIGTMIGVYLGLFALTSVMERKILARVQNRLGPNRVGPFGLLQPVADGIKMLTKEDIVPRAADKILHLAAPVVMMVPALMVLAVLPYGRDMSPVNLQSGILYFFAVGAVTELAVFLAGWSSSNKYSLLGAMRAIAQMISYEIPLIVSALAVVLVTGTLSPQAIVAAQAGTTAFVFPNWFFLTPWGFVAGLVFYTAALAESNRSPFDLPEGESELVAGHLTEYSGFKYATFFMAEYVGMFAVCGLFVTLFLGGWQSPSPLLNFVPSWAWFFAKTAFVAVTMIWVRATLPRLRIDHLLAFAWKFLLPMSFAALIAAAAWHHAGRGPMGWLISAAIAATAYLVLSLRFGRLHRPGQRTYRFSE
jgi:NADH-quinone oxidoreductase subunit H